MAHDVDWSKRLSKLGSGITEPFKLLKEAQTTEDYTSINSLEVEPLRASDIAVIKPCGHIESLRIDAAITELKKAEKRGITEFGVVGIGKEPETLHKTSLFRCVVPRHFTYVGVGHYTEILYALISVATMTAKREDYRPPVEYIIDENKAAIAVVKNTGIQADLALRMFVIALETLRGHNLGDCVYELRRCGVTFSKNNTVDEEKTMWKLLDAIGVYYDRYQMLGSETYGDIRSIARRLSSAI